MPEALQVRLYEELNDYLPDGRRKRDFSCSFSGPIRVGRLLRALGVPASEVELVLVNGNSVGLAHSLESGDRVSVYPVFESLDVKPVLQIRDKPLRETRFTVDPVLRRLAFYLRILGFEVALDSAACLEEKERRIILTTDPELLTSGLPRVYVVREEKPLRQLREVLSRLQLVPRSLLLRRLFHVLQ